MLINTEAFPNDIETAVDWVSGLIGAAVDKRVAGFEQQERTNPLLASHFRNNFPLEFALAKARRYRKSTGRLPRDAEYDALYSFLIPAHRIHSALPREVKGPFEGRLREAVNGLNGARPFSYEISIATHLMQKGWDVEFIDYSGAARFDLLARQEAVEIEVECKTTSGDTGRKIHRQEVNRLADLLLPITQQVATEPGCHRILITVPDRLGKSIQELSAIASVVATAVQDKGSASSELARADYSFDGIDRWPEPGDPDFLPFFEQRFGFRNANLLFQGKHGVSVAAVMIRSAKADSVVDTISSQAKEAADQCSGTRPALIALHLIDELDNSDLRTMLKTPNGLHAIMHALLKGGTRRHVDSVAFTVPQVTQTDGSGARWRSGNLVMLNNPAPLFPCEEVRSIFRPGQN
ncbi:hypothetical protein FXB40_34150 [Bradyrhizobium rifense]|uniref:Uncharacterized protein n=1 Tax=Bradyrhizobium rifense TaxID=515499 RepID=A0A5D3K8Z4_9BRAD|nr:hypothetical protein [Bradyrhizobium rifense]TYL89973.1 hypothetical protein FXB40_34150 [Bradyrhizobium rifense]